MEGSIGGMYDEGEWCRVSNPLQFGFGIFDLVVRGDALVVQLSEAWWLRRSMTVFTLHKMYIFRSDLHAVLCVEPSEEDVC